MGIPCRWHIARVGMPQFRSAAVAIAVVIVGSMLPGPGVVGRTPIVSSDALAPIAAVTGSRDALVAVAIPGDLVPVGPTITGGQGPRAIGDAWSFGDRTLVAASAVAPEPGVPGPDAFAVDAMRAFDPELRADLLVAALAASGPSEPVVAGTPIVAAQGVTTQGSGATATSTTAARTATKNTKRKPRLFKKHWRRHPGPWKVSRKVTWYGPGFYGNRTACGQRYTRYILGVAHRTLPCGTLVQFTWGGRTAVAPVIDRGPYGPPGLVFDWSAWLACKTFKPQGAPTGCFTRSDVKYRVVGKVNLTRWFKARNAEKRRRHG